MDNNTRELSLEEMDIISGGQGGSPDMLPEKEGFWVYQIQSGDCLKSIAKKCLHLSVYYDMFVSD